MFYSNLIFFAKFWNTQDTICICGSLSKNPTSLHKYDSENIRFELHVGEELVLPK